MAPNLLLYLCIVILLEYALKALCEGASGRRRHLSAAAGAAHRSAADRIYALYRVGALIVHAAVLWGLSSLPLGQSLPRCRPYRPSVHGGTGSLASGWLYLRNAFSARCTLCPTSPSSRSAVHCPLHTVAVRPAHILARLHANTLPIFDPATSSARPLSSS